MKALATVRSGRRMRCTSTCSCCVSPSELFCVVCVCVFYLLLFLYCRLYYSISWRLHSLDHGSAPLRPRLKSLYLSILLCVSIYIYKFRPRYHPDTTSRPFAAKLLVRPRRHWPPASFGHAVTGRLPYASTCRYLAKYCAGTRSALGCPRNSPRTRHLRAGARGRARRRGRAGGCAPPPPMAH